MYTHIYTNYINPQMQCKCCVLAYVIIIPTSTAKVVKSATPVHR